MFRGFAKPGQRLDKVSIDEIRLAERELCGEITGLRSLLKGADVIRLLRGEGERAEEQNEESMEDDCGWSASQSPELDCFGSGP